MTKHRQARRDFVRKLALEAAQLKPFLLPRASHFFLLCSLLSAPFLGSSSTRAAGDDAGQLHIGAPRHQPSYLRFSGVNSYAEIPDSPSFSVSAAGLTVAVWMRPDTLTFPVTEGSRPTEKFVHWLGKGSLGQIPNSNEWAFRMYSQTSPPGPRANRISFYVFNPGPGRGCGSYFQDPIILGQWIHVVGVVDARAQLTAIYKNGQFRHHDSYSSKRPTDGKAPLRLGTQSLGSFFKGAIGPVHIWNRPLSAGEIQKLYALNMVPKQGLVAEYRMDERRGSVIHDTAGGHDGDLFNTQWGHGRGPISTTSTGSSGGGC